MSSIFIAAEGVRRAHGWLDLWQGLMLAGAGRWRGCEVLSYAGVRLFRDGDVTNPELDVSTERFRVRIAGVDDDEAHLLVDALEEASVRLSRIDDELALWRLAGGPGDDVVRMAVIDDQMRYVFVNEPLASWHNQGVAAHTGRTMREVIGVMAESAEPVVREVIQRGVERRVVFSGGIVDEVGQVYKVRYSPIRVGTQTLCRAEVRQWMWPGSARDAHGEALDAARIMHLQNHESPAVRWEFPDGVHEVQTPIGVLRRAVREALLGFAQSRTCVVRSRVVGRDLAMVFRGSTLDHQIMTPATKRLMVSSGGAVFVADDVQLRFPLRDEDPAVGCRG